MEIHPDKKPVILAAGFYLNKLLLTEIKVLY